MCFFKAAAGYRKTNSKLRYDISEEAEKADIDTLQTKSMSALHLTLCLSVRPSWR
jgi:hypothetical protein